MYIFFLEPPLLFWMDLETSDPRAVSDIRGKYSELEIIFRSKYSDAEAYLAQHSRGMDEREKIVVICRSYYASEKKSFIDIAQLFQACNFRNIYIAVYTSNRAEVLKRYANLPKDVEIFDARADLLAFVDRCFA